MSTLRLKIIDATCDCDTGADCDCAAYQTCSVQLDGLGGYGMGQWVLDPKSQKEVIQMRTLWGDFTVAHFDAAKEELERRLKPINPDLVVHMF